MIDLMMPAHKNSIASLSSWAKKGIAAGAHGLTWLAILMSVFQVFLVVPPKSWAVTGGTTLTVVPSPPSGLTAIDHPADDGLAIDLSWTPSTSTGVAEQRIYRATTTGGPYSLATTIANNTTSTYTDSTGLTNGTTYYYIVRAFGGGQESGNSNEANAIPSDNTAPVAPTSLSAADVAGDNGGAIVLNWTPSASGDVAQQRLYRGTTLGGPYPTTVTTISNNTTSTYTDTTGLTNGTTYYYVIRAYDGTQESVNSNEANAIPVNNPPNPPTGVTASDAAGDNGGAIVLNWTLSASTDATQQRIYRGTGAGGPYPTSVTTIVNNTTSTYTDNTGLTNGTTYYYVIRTYDGTQESGDSNETSAAPVDNIAPNAPATLSASDVAGDNGGAIALNWTPSASGDVTQQRIYRGTTLGGPYPTSVTTIGNNTTASYTDNTGLLNGTTYYYVIRAYDGTQESANSNESNAAPTDNTAPNAPATLSASDVAGDNGGAIALNWTPSASGDVTQQRIYRGTTLGGPYPTSVTTIGNNTTATYTDNTGLLNGTTYYYVIRAYDGTQESGNSNEANAVPIGDIASATNSAITAISPVYANGISVSTVTVTVRDNTNNPVAGATVTLSSSRGATDTITQPAGTTNISGQITGTVRSSTTGNPVISAVANGTINLVNTAAINFYNTPAGSNVVISPISSTEVTFTTVTGVGTTAAQENPTGTPLPSGYLSPAYYDISTTAAYTGTVSICITYNEVQYLGNESRVKLLHYETGTWVNRTSGPVDTVNNKVCGNVTSFSEFATGEATVPTITTASLPDGTVGASYSATLTASDGVPPLAWSIFTSSLPAGLSLNSSTGVISGNPTTAGTSNFTVRVTDANSATNDKALSIMIYSAISITTTSLIDGTVGAAYNQTVSATGGKTPYSWSIVSGNLPAGLSLNASTGVISGTPSAAGTYNFTIQVQDANSAVVTQALSIVIYVPLSITTTALADGTVSIAYSQTLIAAGGKTPYTWSITSGGLPAGLTLNPGTGVISGTPTATGASSFTVQVTDANSQIASRALSITIYSGVAVTTAVLPDGTMGLSYNTTLTATGGATPYTWSITVGTLPPGLSLNSSTGLISGTPATAGSYPITVQVTDNNLVTNTKDLSITTYSAISFVTTSLNSGTVSAAYNQTMTASGGKTPYTWSITVGALPPGLALNTSTGGISGTPTTAGTYNFTARVMDANGAPDVKALSIVISSGLSITTSSLPDGTVNLAYNQTLTVSGGNSPFTWAMIVGGLPAGLSLDSGTGVISGTPTASGTSNFTVQVTDANSAVASRSLSITIYGALTITTSSLPQGTRTAAYNQTVAAAGGKTPYAWSVTVGSLPAGLSLSSATGEISGTPTAAGPSNFTVQVLDANGATAIQALSIQINNVPLITTVSLPGGTSGTSYNQALAQTGGTLPLNWGITAGSLSTGLTLNSNTGVIAGIPTVSGVYNFTVTLTDIYGVSDSRPYTVTIVPGNPARTNISASKSTIVADGTDSAGLTVTVYDANNNLVADGTTVTVTSTNGAVSGTGTTVSGVVSRTITSIVSGAAALGVESPSGTPLATITGTTALSFIPGPPAQANIMASKTTVISDGVDQTTLTITVRDAQGNLVTDGTTVTLTTTLGTVTGSGNTINGVVSRYLSSITTGTATLGVQSPTGTPLSTVTGNTSILFSSGGPGRAVISASKTALIADGVDNSTLTVTVYDANNNLVTNGTTVTVTTTLGTVTGTGTTVSGIVTRSLSATVSGTAVLGVQAPAGTTLSNVTGNTAIVFSPGPPAQANIVASKTTIVADGTDSTLLTITVRDTTGNLVPDGTTVRLTTTLGTVTGSGTTVTGVVTRTLTGTVSGTANLGVESPVGTLLTTVTGNTAITLQPGLPAGAITLSPSPASIIANGVSTSTVTSGVIRDAYNNPVLNGTLITVATGSGSITTADASGVDPGIQVATASGAISFVVQSSTAIGTANITAVSVAGSASGSTQIAFVADTPSAANSSMTATSPVYSDGVSASTVTIIVRDIYNNPFSGASVTLSSSRGVLDTITQPVGVTDGNGRIIGTAASTSPGDAVITATVNGSVVLAQTAAINFYNTQTGTNIAVSAGNNTSVTFGTVITIGITTSTPSGAGTALPAGYATPVYFDISTTAVFSGNVTICITYNEATYAAREGLVKILHKEGSLLVDRTTSVNTATNTVCGMVTSFSEFATASTAATNLQVTTSSQAVVSGDVSSAVQVEAKDNNGATDTGYSGTANISSNSPSLYLDPISNGTFSQTAISVNMVNGVGTFYFKDTDVGTPTITVTDAAAILSPTSQQESITAAVPSGVITLTPVPGSIVADGTATSTVTSGVIQDVYGNSVSNGTLITVAANLGTITTADVSGTYSGIQLATVNGVISFVVQSGTWVGTANVTAASVQGSASGNAQIAFLPGLPSGTITLAPIPASIIADGTSVSTVTSGVITDVYGNTVSDGTWITVATDRGTITTADASGADPGIQVATVSGVISYVVRSGTVSGIANVTAASVQGSASGNAQIAFLPGLPSGMITLAPTPASIVADGAAISTVTSGVIQDVYGNSVSNGTLITVATDLGTITTADVSGADPGIQVTTISGVITFVVRSGTVRGTANVTAASVAGSAAGSTTIAFISGPPYGTINLTPNPAIILADGVSTSTITSGVITDINGITVSDGTLITVATDRGTITTADVSGADAGIQMATSLGTITFILRAGTTEGVATVTAASVEGSANGQATVTLTNVAPELNYSSESGYGNGDAVEPNSGIRSTVYTYKIIYRDVNNNAPLYIRICIDSTPCAAMNLDAGAVNAFLRDGNYSNGEQYVYTISTLSSGNHTFYFQTSDGLASTKLPPAGSLTGPYVNYPPGLSYSLEPGYGTDGVDPNTGNTTVLFNFKVVYSDLDNQAPASIRVCIDGVCYAMSVDTSASATLRDSDYRNDEQYVYSTLLSEGTHNYYFSASDSLEGALLPTSGNLSGPIVTNTYTPVGTDVVVRPDPDVTVTFTQVTASGDTYVTRSQTGSSLPSGYLHGVPPAYFDIYTTATYTGKVKICYTYQDIQYFGIGYGGERGLRWLHYESGSFKDRTVMLDVNTNMVCGEVYSFSEFSASVEQATLVTLTSFMATGLDGKVLLTWATSSEVDSIGFNILRGTSSDGPFTRINDWVIRSKGTSTRGMTYTHDDVDVKNGITYFYRLENVDINGRIAAHMIASATPSAPAVAEEVPESSETLSPAALGSEAVPSGEEIPEVHPVAEAPAEVDIYREVPAAAGVESPSGISESSAAVGEGEGILREATDTGKEALEAVPVIGDRVPEGRPAISEPAEPEARRGAPKGFTLKIADDAGNEMEVSLPEEAETVQDPFEVVVLKDGKIALKWSAKGNLRGFNVLRLEVGQGKEKAKEHAKVNLLPMPFFASQSGDKGLVYHFKDAGAGQGKMYSYKVETIFSDGTSRESRSIEISTVGMENAK